MGCPGTVFFLIYGGGGGGGINFASMGEISVHSTRLHAPLLDLHSVQRSTTQNEVSSMVQIHICMKESPHAKLLSLPCFLFAVPLHLITFLLLVGVPT